MEKMYTFDIAGHFLSAIINNDYSGLSEHEEELLKQFLRKHDIGHYSFTHEDGDPYFAECEVCLLRANCHKVIAWNDYTE